MPVHQELCYMEPSMSWDPHLWSISVLSVLQNSKCGWTRCCHLHLTVRYSTAPSLDEKLCINNTYKDCILLNSPSKPTNLIHPPPGNGVSSLARLLLCDIVLKFVEALWKRHAISSLGGLSCCPWLNFLCSLVKTWTPGSLNYPCRILVY